MEIGQAVKIARIVAKVRQKHLANRLGISPSYLSLIENGERELTVEMLVRIGAELGVRPSVLLEMIGK